MIIHLATNCMGYFHKVIDVSSKHWNKVFIIMTVLGFELLLGYGYEIHVLPVFLGVK